MRRLACIFLCAPVFGGCACAQALPPGSIPIQTVATSYVPTPLAETPASVTVITADEMQRRGDTTLVQALAAVPGLNVVPSGGSGNTASVFIQGSNSEDVLVLLDGVPINDPSTSNGLYNFGVEALADIARIVVIRGPMSGLYGSGAIGGVINLITRRGSGAPHVDYDLAGGFPGQGQGSATLSGRSGAFDYAITGALIEQAGFDDLARRLSVYRGIRDPFRYKLGSLNLGYTPVDGTRISLIVRARQTGSTYPELGYPIFDDPYENTYDSQVFTRFGVKSRLLDRHLTTSLYVSHVQDDRRYLALLDPDDPNGFAGNSSYASDQTMVQFNNILRLDPIGPVSNVALVAGFEQKRDVAYQDLNESFFGSPYLSTVNASQIVTSFHASAQGTLFHRLSLLAALRDDGVSGYGNIVTGRVGAVLAIPVLSTRLKASYGTGFLAPSLYDLHGVDSYGYRGNPALRPERSAGYQIGATTTLAGFGRSDFATISVDYFHNNIKDLIEFVQISPTASTEQNVAIARIHGVETEIDLHPAAWLDAKLGYTWTIARDGATHATLLRRPENAGSVQLDIRPIPQLGIDPEIRYVGRFSDYLYQNNGYPITTGNGIGYAKSGTIADLTISYRISPALTIYATGRNLFNSRFEPVDGLQIPGQNFLFGIRGRIGM